MQSSFKQHNGNLIFQYCRWGEDLPAKIYEDRVLVLPTATFSSDGVMSSHDKRVLGSLLPYYGIEYNINDYTPSVSRIGNMDMHRTLPIQSKMRGCLLNDNGDVVEYLPEDDWTSVIRDGSAGQVMVEIPEHYRKFETNGNTNRVLLSEIPLDGFHKVSKRYVSAYGAVLDREEMKLCSIVNDAPRYRGGNNTSSWDNTTRSLLGVPVSNLKKGDMRTYARNRKPETCEWNIMDYDTYKTICWLYVVEYANRRSNATFNPSKTSEGLMQGGLGRGYTNVDRDAWAYGAGQCPFIHTGTLDHAGNYSCVDFVGYMPCEFDAYLIDKKQHTVLEYDSTKTYNVGDFVYGGTSCGGSFPSLYKVIKMPDVNTVLGDTEYFTEINRTDIKAMRYRGIDNLWGHISTMLDGIAVVRRSKGNDVYVTYDKTLYKESDIEGFERIGSMPYPYYGFSTKIAFGENGDVLTIAGGGDTSIYFCDSCQCPSVTGSEALTCFMVGSTAQDHGSGLFSQFADNSINGAYKAYGSRLCFIPDEPETTEVPSDEPETTIEE
jgi:hypothetical protein